jgi:hypothetical protein
MSYHRSHRLFFWLLLAIFPVWETILCLEMQCIVSLILMTRRTKAELHIKGINKEYIQFAFKVDFLLCLSSYVGSKNGKVSTPKVLAPRPNLHNGMHASLWPEDNKQKDVDKVQLFFLSTTAPLCIAGMQKKKRKVVLTGIRLWAQICAHLNFELCDCLITFPIYVLSQRLIARNVRELFSFNCGVSH